MKKFRILIGILLILAAACLSLGFPGLMKSENNVEAVSSYIAPEADKIKNTEDIPLYQDLFQARELLLDIPLSISGFCGNISIKDTSQKKVDSTLFALGPDWFTIYPHFLLQGRILSPSELEQGAHSALIDNVLAYALWGTHDVVGNTILIENLPFEVVGVIEQRKEPAYHKRPHIYIPLLAAAQNKIELDTQILAAQNTFFNKIKTVFESISPKASIYILPKECMREKLALHYLLIFLAAIILYKLYNHIHPLLQNKLNIWKQKQKECYFSDMFYSTIWLIIIFFVFYALFFAGIVFLIHLSIEPAFTFIEWIPKDPSNPSTYLPAIYNALKQQYSWNRSISPSVFNIRYHGFFLNLTALFGFLCISVFFIKSKSK